MLLCACFSVKAQTALPQAHAHNDYEHKRPLLDALDHGFISVEADVWLIEGSLYVYHDRPAAPDPERTLEKLYLAPLVDWVKEHQGKVYQNYDEPFYLMIDFKNRGLDTYLVLKPLLERYRALLEGDGPVRVFISGQRPVEQILRENKPLAALDGRSADLGRGISPALMPVVSASLRSYTNWKGEGAIHMGDLKEIKAFIEAVHREAKKVRFWANPDHPAGWEKLLELGVDLINTDKLEAFEGFMRKRQ